jgi:hypothetical protein
MAKVSRRVPRLTALAAVVLLEAALFAAPARADVEAISLTYRADPGCPDESRFQQEVTARTARARWAAPDEAARAFVVTATAEAGTVRGTLSISNLDGSSSRREITGDTCGEVVSVLALIPALAIDPLARMATPATPGVGGATAGDATPPQAPAPAPPAPPESARKSTAAVAPPLSHPPSAPAPLPAEPSSETARAPAASGSARRVRWAIGIDSHWLAGLVPGSPFGGGAFVDVAGRARGYLVPSFRVSLVATTARVDFAQAIGAELDWFVSRLEACPIRFAWPRAGALSLCAALDAGVLRSDGTGLTNALTDVRPWLASAALGRLTWSAFANVFIEGGGGVTAQVTRYSFSFREAGVSEPPLHQIPLFAATLDVDAGYRFP